MTILVLNILHRKRHPSVSLFIYQPNVFPLLGVAWMFVAVSPPSGGGGNRRRKRSQFSASAASVCAWPGSLDSHVLLAEALDCDPRTIVQVARPRPISTSTTPATPRDLPHRSGGEGRACVHLLRRVRYGDSVGNRAPGRCACARVAVSGVRPLPQAASLWPQPTGAVFRGTGRCDPGRRRRCCAGRRIARGWPRAKGVASQRRPQRRWPRPGP